MIKKFIFVCVVVVLVVCEMDSVFIDGFEICLVGIVLFVMKNLCMVIGGEVV